ncbi:MAG: type II toxin-antitoxin system HipA family toxin YjjJ, partial [Deltaproteobacteria bacterium]|nr:type II toxin-antitoxin system HipA family toxin YjjJ [Deltaproteobacteria bacterium]
MPKKENLNYHELEKGLKQFLARSGPSSASEAYRHLGCSQATFSRLLSRMEGRVLQVGKGRLTRYALLGMLPDGHAKVPVYAIKEDGTAKSVALLHGIEPKGYYLESKTETLSSNFYPSLPYLFEDLRPSGFLGRLVPRLYPALQAPDNIQNWNDADCLQYLTQYGWDLIGNYLLGENAFEQYLRNTLYPPDLIPREIRPKRYPELAERVMSVGIPGSSAAGEHPKFLAMRKDPREIIPVLVKFSPPLSDPISKRVADLLICEHLAHQVLRAHGQISATSCLLVGENRLFLEVERFDRTGKGRKGLLSLRSLDLQFVGNLKSWTDTAEALFSQKKIDAAALATIRWLEIFGRLIGNTDMHHGNLSFFHDGEKLLGLAPVYDMLPMLYAPQQNQLVLRDFKPSLPKPSESSVWTGAWKAACDFWQEVVNCQQVTDEF